MNVSYVVIIYFTSLFVLSLADEAKPIQKRILKLKNVNYNKTEGKPKTTKKSQKNKTIFVLSNPVIYPQKLHSTKPTASVVTQSDSHEFDFLNFDAYILKPRNINYTALLSHSDSNAQEKESKAPEPTTSYPQNEFLDFPRAEALVQTTLPPAPIEIVTYETTTTQKTKKPSIFVETTTPKVNYFFPLGLAYFDSLRKYRKEFESLRKREKTKKPRIKTTAPTTTTTTTTTTTFAPTQTTETEEPYIETTTAREYGFVVTPNFDEDLYEEPHFESYRYKPRYHLNYEDETERDRFETTTRYLDYETLDRDDNRYETTETITTTTKLPNSVRRKPKNKNLHSSHVKSNYLFDRYTNYPQEEESRQVVSVAKNADHSKEKRSLRSKYRAVTKKDKDKKGGTKAPEKSAGDDKQHKNIVPMQRHYFQ